GGPLNGPVARQRAGLVEEIIPIGCEIQRLVGGPRRVVRGCGRDRGAGAHTLEIVREQLACLGGRGAGPAFGVASRAVAPISPSRRKRGEGKTCHRKCDDPDCRCHVEAPFPSLVESPNAWLASLSMEGAAPVW